VRLLFICDARSPIARNWMGYFLDRGDEVHVISSYPLSTAGSRFASIHVVPLSLSTVMPSRMPTMEPRVRRADRAALSQSLPARGKRFDRLARKVQMTLAPLDLHRHVNRTRTVIAEVAPDLVHALRIPFEGMLGAMAVREQPLIISVWGNDFTLHAAQNRVAGIYTRRSMRHANGLHADCQRDARLARAYGFSGTRPSVVLPGGGGVHVDLFYPGGRDAQLGAALSITMGCPVVINPRGIREYVHTEAFFQAIPLVLRVYPEAVFLCIAMADSNLARNWVSRLAIERSVRLLPAVPHEDMATYFRFAAVAVSPSAHDGTPNTLLESMACGCLPVAGDIDSVREWITDGVNGLLCDPRDPSALACAIIRSLADDSFRAHARTHNGQVIAERAEYGAVMRSASAFYDHVVRQYSLGSTPIER